MKLQKGKRYQADITLNGVQMISPNSLVENKFAELGFINVTATGTGAKRTVQGMWSGTTVNIDLPAQVSNVKEI